MGGRYRAAREIPGPGHEPQAYIVVLVNTRIREKMYEYDVGAAIENMILAALGEGIASCWLISIDKPKVVELLGIPDSLQAGFRPGLGISRPRSRRPRISTIRRNTGRTRT